MLGQCNVERKGLQITPQNFRELKFKLFRTQQVRFTVNKNLNFSDSKSSLFFLKDLLSPKTFGLNMFVFVFCQIKIRTFSDSQSPIKVGTKKFTKILWGTQHLMSVIIKVKKTKYIIGSRNYLCGVQKIEGGLI